MYGGLGKLVNLGLGLFLVHDIIGTIRSNNWTYKFFVGTKYLQGGLLIEGGR